ncbi:NAD-dependent epimerase/dehydratase family protein [Methylobacterium sp. NEAU 140]|uniref:NAD-dependent epimerase/dehydratase family protein n=1 Tax=Methylobacterium sp. NEAU 140 TaxID=3064945 RepID=UPI0027372AA2|nr:NAD-dependent epimerase/dehydratase family protein [Methylobacterium sp. NEAU 140]MDP4025999.1 NAD-dependent epimerase/dehydratase family protein [Methylobacterium sp. NEAU 140]
MRNRHIVIGGSGFIGRHVCRTLIEHGHSVEIVSRTLIAPSIEGSKFSQLDLSTATVEEIIHVIDESETIHHYAWSTVPHTAEKDPVGDLYQNVGSTLKLLEAAKRLGGKRIVFASSGGTVYGKLNSIPAGEDHRLNPINAYGISKVTCENYLNLFRNEYGLDIRIARISNPYGPGQNALRGQGVIATFIYNALFNREIEIFGDGTIVRDFIHIHDVAAALFKLSTVEFEGSDLPRTYNIGGGEKRSINSIVESISRCVVGPFAVKRSEGRAFDVPISVLDITNAQKYLSWKPLIFLDQGIQWMVEDIELNRDNSFGMIRR